MCGEFDGPLRAGCPRERRVESAGQSAFTRLGEGVEAGLEEGGALGEVAQRAPGLRGDVRVLRIEVLELAEGPAVQLLEGGGEVPVAGLEDVEAEALGLGGEEDAGVGLDGLELGEGGEEGGGDGLGGGGEGGEVDGVEEEVLVEGGEDGLSGLDLGALGDERGGFVDDGGGLDARGGDMAAHLGAGGLEGREGGADGLQLLARLLEIQ